MMNYKSAVESLRVSLEVSRKGLGNVNLSTACSLAIGCGVTTPLKKL